MTVADRLATLKPQVILQTECSPVLIASHTHAGLTAAETGKGAFAVSGNLSMDITILGRWFTDVEVARNAPPTLYY